LSASDCRRIESLLPPYVDGEASFDVVSEVDRHLTTCAACRDEVAAGRTARAVVRARAAELRTAAPPGLRTRIVAAMAPEPVASLGWVGRAAAFGAAAVIVLGVLTALEFVPAPNNALFAAQLAIDHVRCFIVHLGTIDGAAPADVQRQFQERYGWAVDVPPPNDDLGLTLIAARRCPFWLGSHAHLLYRHGGREWSLYVTPGETRPGETLAVLGHVERIWSADGQVYALVSSGAADPDFDRISAYLQDQTTTPR
jgi:anti-sigma factor RsiW